jgi:CheY-like chemotaxis protein/anti-sigma regulatory factor (Ser/Thr protein kinase)
VNGDASRVQQVVSNLLSNAIKFTAHGRVTVEAHRRGDHVEIAVRDTGQGIAPEFLPHVFESFRQAESSTRRPHPGLGLGLAIVRHLVELHGGTVAAASEGVGRGATFTVRLPAGPAAAGAGPGARAPGTPEQRIDFTGRRILVVDDQADARELLSTLLQQFGAAVTEATSVPTALDALGRQPVDLVISDIGMPDQDGYDLIRQVRALPDPARAGVTMMALTAFARDADRGDAVAAGYDAHLAKPVDPRHLVTAVAALLGARPGR